MIRFALLCLRDLMPIVLFVALILLVAPYA
jgi:hypothetical protein